MAKHRMPPMGGMGGMGNMNNMIKQAQKMQQDMLKMQEEMEVAEFEATSGGGAVTVKVSGKKEVTAIKINPEVVDADDVEMLEDLILVAVNDAMKKVDGASSERLGKLTGGMNIPGLF
ncbi:MAG: YbaB/EbfC family nucleoid-associated protein [Clostridia bacterium]|nr:YbaB/EbfC family nucleoid-associated protein [Clostridia bacterium]